MLYRAKFVSFFYTNLTLRPIGLVFVFLRCLVFVCVGVWFGFVVVLFVWVVVFFFLVGVVTFMPCNSCAWFVCLAGSCGSCPWLVWLPAYLEPCVLVAWCALLVRVARAGWK